MQESINKLSEYLDSNGLVLSVKKTKFMVFSKRHNTKDLDVRLHYRNEPIELVDNFKYLGVILDVELNFRAQMDVIEQRVSRAIGIVSRLRRQVDLKMFQLLINAYVLSYFDETSIIWGTSQTFLNEMQCKVGKLVCDFFYPRQVRVPGSIFKHSIYNSLSSSEKYWQLEKFNLLSIPERVDLFSVTFVYKLLFLEFNVEPLNNLFILRVSDRASRNDGMLVVPNATNAAFSRCILIRLTSK